MIVIPVKIFRKKLKKKQKYFKKNYENEAKGAYIRSRVKWMGEDERNTEYFLNLEKNNGTKKHIRSIKKTLMELC